MPTTDLPHYGYAKVTDEPWQVAGYGGHGGEWSTCRWLCIFHFWLTASISKGTKKQKMAEYDLTKTIIPYLDRHLAFPLLAHLVETNLFPVEEVQVAQYELAKGTNMVDYTVSLFEQLYPDQPVPAGSQSILAL